MPYSTAQNVGPVIICWIKHWHALHMKSARIKLSMDWLWSTKFTVFSTAYSDILKYDRYSVYSTSLFHTGSIASVALFGMGNFVHIHQLYYFILVQVQYICVVYVCMCVCVCMYVRMYACLCLCVCMLICMCIWVCIFVCTSVCVCVFVWVCDVCIHFMCILCICVIVSEWMYWTDVQCIICGYTWVAYIITFHMQMLLIGVWRYNAG